MKKIYMNPEITVIRVEAAQLMVTSPGYGGSTDGQSGNLSRDFDDWDE